MVNEIRRRQNAAIKASYIAAQKLDTIGMPVHVQRDDGSMFTTKLTALPWSLGHGAWVAGVQGISGGYDCARITPAKEKKAS